MKGRRLLGGYANCCCRFCLRGKGYKRWKKRQMCQQERREKKQELIKLLKEHYENS